VLISVERFWIEFLRGNERVFSIFSEAQVIATLLVIFGVSLLLRRGQGASAR
jgi:prolipoprotein diacylglyceryltransferase